MTKRRTPKKQTKPKETTFNAMDPDDACQGWSATIASLGALMCKGHSKRKAIHLIKAAIDEVYRIEDGLDDPKAQMLNSDLVHQIDDMNTFGWTISLLDLPTAEART